MHFSSEANAYSGNWTSPPQLEQSFENWVKTKSYSIHGDKCGYYYVFNTTENVFEWPQMY